MDAQVSQKSDGSVNPELLAAVPISAGHVLELGCGAGALGAAWKRRNPRGLWSGIKFVADAARSAQGVLDNVLCADIETIDDAALDAFLEGRPAPDVLVFGDVLEHLRDPLAVLRQLVDRLAPGGTVAACIPNIGHWSGIASLMAGEWSYTDSGLLDRTHLRFFTQRSARALLEEAGLDVRKMTPRKVPLDAARQERFLAVIAPALHQLGIDAAEAVARMQALQYVFVAQKPPLRPLLAIHQWIMTRGQLQARTDPPVAALGSLPDVVATASAVNEGVPKPSGEHDHILVMQRQMVVNRDLWFASIRSLIAKGWLLVAEWDDHPDLLPAPAKAIWDTHPWLSMSCVHACQVSTPLLAEAFRAHNPTVAVLANALLDLPPLAKRSGEHIRVVYAALNRTGVAGLVAKALDAAAAADSRVEIAIVHDEDLFAALRTPQRSFLPLLPYKDYLELLETADIAVLPIVGRESETYKSPLKFLECASRGAVCVASPTLYADVIRDGETGIIAHTGEEWTRSLQQLVADPAERWRLAEAAWSDVRDRHMMATQVAAREAWYRQLCANRAELTRALLARHPELS
jgi:SAM-dependent methyltransferase